MNKTGALHIRTAKDVVETLRSPDPGIRFSILRAIIQHPDQAAAYGASERWDFVDELCNQTRNLTGSPLRTLVLGALIAYRDPRVREIFKKEINTSENGENLSMAARYLAGEVEEGESHCLSGLLLQNNSLKHAQAAATVMMPHKHHSDQERIRIAMLSSDELFTAPKLNDATELAWSTELQGPYYSHARRVLEGQGETAFIYLRKRWDTLTNGDKIWLLRWGADTHQAYVMELILLGLDSDPLVLAALEAIVRMGEYGKIFAVHAGRCLKSINPAVRCAAVKAGASGVDWEAALTAEDDALVKIQMLARLTEDKGAAAAPALIRLIEAGDYRISAAATTALKTLGKDVSELMKPLMKHSHQALQVAAAQVLIAAGEELWLEEQMLG